MKPEDTQKKFDSATNPAFGAKTFDRTKFTSFREPPKAPSAPKASAPPKAAPPKTTPPKASAPPKTTPPKASAPPKKSNAQKADEQRAIDKSIAQRKAKQTTPAAPKPSTTTPRAIVKSPSTSAGPKKNMTVASSGGKVGTPILKAPPKPVAKPPVKITKPAPTTSSPSTKKKKSGPSFSDRVRGNAVSKPAPKPAPKKPIPGGTGTRTVFTPSGPKVVKDKTAFEGRR